MKRITTSPSLIFYADDDPVYLHLFRATMEEVVPHFQVKFFSNGQELLRGLDELGKQHNLLPNIIISDIEMPVMNGLTVLQKIKEIKVYQQIPKLIISSLSKSLIEDQVLALGASGYIEKPNFYEEFKQLMILIDQYWATLFSSPVH